VQQGVGTRSSTKNNAWERRSHAYPPHYNPGHVTSTMRRDNWLEFKSSWLGFRIGAYGQGFWSSFRFRGSVFGVRVSPTVNSMQTRDDRIVDFHYPILTCFRKMISVSDPNPVFLVSVSVYLGTYKSCHRKQTTLEQRLFCSQDI